MDEVLYHSNLFFIIIIISMFLEKKKRSGYIKNAIYHNCLSNFFPEHSVYASLSKK